MTGMLLIALPAFFGKQSHTAVGGVETVTTRTEGIIPIVYSQLCSFPAVPLLLLFICLLFVGSQLEYIVARGLLVSISDAIERIMLAYKEIAELEGYTGTITLLFIPIYSSFLPFISIYFNFFRFIPVFFFFFFFLIFSPIFSILFLTLYFNSICSICSHA
jgi:hypothetical protein